MKWMYIKEPMAGLIEFEKVISSLYKYTSNKKRQHFRWSNIKPNPIATPSSSYNYNINLWYFYLTSSEIEQILKIDSLVSFVFNEHSLLFPENTHNKGL